MKTLTSLLALALSLGHVVAAEVPADALYLDTKQPVEKRVADLVSRLTLEEKARLLNHKGSTVERFNIRADQWNQCLNGVKWDRPTTLFPTCIGMAATWNTDLVQNKIAKVLSDEARAIYNGWHLDPQAKGEHKGLIYRAPVINIERNPYWGRNHEAWGEDPFLTGRMAVAYVRGIQGNDPAHLKLAATLKHYAVNNVESDRTKLDAKVSERMLHEYWLPHFRDAVVEGKAQSLMASYNAINGTPNNINHWLLTDLLKNEWKHEGFVVSDLGGVKTMVEGHEKGKMTYVDAVAQSVMAGCDFSDKEFEQNIPAAVREGKITEERLNDALSRVLRTRFLLGEFDAFEAGPYSKIPPSVVDSSEHRAIALEASRQSIVLLQNRDKLLPLDRTKIKRIAVLGPLADQVIYNNYNGTLPTSVTPLKGIRNRAGETIEILHAYGALVAGKPKPWARVSDESKMDPKVELDAAVAAAEKADVAIVFVGTHAGIEQEARDRETLGLTGTQEELVKAVVAANPRTIVVQMSGGPLTVPALKEKVPAMLQAWWPGEEGGNAIADVIFGDVNPAGRLPHTVYASESQVPSIDEYDITKGFTYMYVKGEPLYPFGHGLSYTTFAYSDFKAPTESIRPDGKLDISLNVKNTGDRAGDEVVQLYVRALKPSVTRPAKELRGFQRITLSPGSEKTVNFTVPAAKLAYYDEGKKAFVVEPGEYEIMAGASSSDIRTKATVTVQN